MALFGVAPMSRIPMMTTNFRQRRPQFDPSGPPPAIPHQPLGRSPAIQASPAQIPVIPFNPSANTRTSSSANFLQSVGKNNAIKAAGTMRKANIASNLAQGAPSPAPAIMAPAVIPPIPSTGPTTKNTWPAAQSTDSTKARARIVTGTPEIPAVPANPAQHVQNEIQRSRNVASQQNRGLGLQVQDGGAFQPIPPMPGTAAVPATREDHRADFDRPVVNPALAQAAQAADADYYRQVADIQSGGEFFAQGLAQQQVGAIADTAAANLQAHQNRAIPRIPGTSTQPKDTTIDNISRNYQAALAQQDSPAAEYWKAEYERATRGAVPSVEGNPAASPAVEMPNAAQPSGQEAAPDASAPPTEADYEFTAKKHGITVEELKRRLGAK